MGNDVMRPTYRFLHSTVPSYLTKLPVPKDWAAFLKMKGDAWLKLAPFLITVILVLFVQVRGLVALFERKPKLGQVNHTVDKSVAKVVHFDSLASVGETKDAKKVFCRCWKSKKFPLCDGSHVAHNRETGDNVGPLIVKADKMHELMASLVEMRKEHAALRDDVDTLRRQK
jgi:CDGSH-type Zn-finger protein